jgi:ABC-type sugar transport system substrate-binding protein
MKHFNRFPFTLLVILLVVALAAAACAAPAPEAPPAQPPAPAPTQAPVVEAPAPDAFTLAPGIAARLASGEPLRIYVSYHDVSNEFAPFLKGRCGAGRGDLGVRAQFVGPVGADAEAQIAELESLVEAGVDGLAISSVSTDALAPVINRFLRAGHPGGDLQHRQPGQQPAVLCRPGPGAPRVTQRRRCWQSCWAARAT